MLKTITLKDLASRFDVSFEGDHDLNLTGLAPLDLAQKNQISFLVNPIYRQQAIDSQAGVLIVNSADLVFVKQESKSSKSFLISSNPNAFI